MVGRSGKSSAGCATVSATSKIICYWPMVWGKIILSTNFYQEMLSDIFNIISCPSSSFHSRLFSFVLGWLLLLRRQRESNALTSCINVILNSTLFIHQTVEKLKVMNAWNSVYKLLLSKLCWNIKLNIFLKDFIYLFLERWRGKEKQRGRNIRVWLPVTRLLLGTLAANPGMCPDWESKWRLFGLQACAQSTNWATPARAKIFERETLLLRLLFFF